MSSRQRDIGGIEGGQRESASPVKGRNYLLAIAINKYAHHPKLYNCVKDAKDIIQQLVYKYNFESQQVFELYDEAASIDNIYKHITDLSKVVTEKDKVMIFFAGHGYFDKDSQTGHLIPVNAEEKKVWDYLSNSNLLDWIRAIKSMHTFVVLDSCFSGSMFSSRGSATTFAENVSNYKSRWGLAAGRIETVDDGFHGENSPFAKAIISFLKDNNSTKFAVSDLIQHVKKVTSNNSGQTPIAGPIRNLGDEGGEFVFELKTDVISEWKKALDTNSSAAYSNFILNFPKSEFIGQAKEYLHQRKEIQMWRYIQDMPHKELEEVVEKQQMVAEYKFNYPQGKFGIKANELSIHLSKTEELLTKKQNHKNNASTQGAVAVQPSQSTDNNVDETTIDKRITISNHNTRNTKAATPKDYWWNMRKIVAAIMIPIIAIAGYFSFTFFNQSDNSGSIEDFVFNMVKDSKDVQSHVDFIAEFPNSEYISEVQAMKADLEFWQKMLAKDNKNAYESYVLLFEDEGGRFLAEAKAAIKDFEKEELVIDLNSLEEPVTTPKSPSLDPGKTAEDKAWDKVKDVKTERESSKVESFVKKYPKGKHRKNADKLLSAITYWENNAEKQRTVKSYKDYLKAYPNGPHKKDAIAAIEALQASEEEYWESTKTRNSEKAYQHYQKVYPSSKHNTAAKKAISKIKEKKKLQLLKQSSPNQPQKTKK